MLAKALNDLAELLEAAKPRKGLKHQKHAATLNRIRTAIVKVLASYFSRQEAALLKAVKPKIPGLLSIREATRTPQGSRFASTLLPTSLSPLSFAVTSEETDDYNSAIQDAIAGGAAQFAKELKGSETISDDIASNWLRDNSLTKLTGNFSGESIDRLRNAVADAWDRGADFNGIVAAIRDTFSDFSTTRAEMIAQTEGNDAYLEGREAMAQEMGMEEKHWVADGTDCCDDCQDQIDAGWIDIDDDFPSGDDPPLHPRCDCGVDYRQGHAD